MVCLVVNEPDIRQHEGSRLEADAYLKAWHFGMLGTELLEEQIGSRIVTLLR